MKYLILIFAILLNLATFASSQDLPKPKKVPAPDSAEQKATIQQGIALHDQKKYDDAITKYKAVLDANPDSTMAMYEIALSLYNKGDKAAAKEMSLRGANYISDELPLFYGMIANILDDEGKPNDAIKLYRDAEEILGSTPDTGVLPRAFNTISRSHIFGRRNTPRLEPRRRKPSNRTSRMQARIIY